MDGMEGIDTHVRSLRRGLLEKKPLERRRGPVSEEEVNAERAALARIKAAATMAPPSGFKTHKASSLGKSVRGSSNEADKAGKVGKRGRAGRAAAARGAKKGTRGAGRPSKQRKRPMHTQSRTNVRGQPGGGSKGGGRGSQKGARGKSGAKERPSPRKGTK
ncbi:MAG: hypothetical protein E6J78_19820 [Deltaproteobacteria bacterium]|nr:MAG: hypothetical protein E6J78_19820 [Deltaproteobacteria bacterium]